PRQRLQQGSHRALGAPLRRQERVVVRAAGRGGAGAPPSEATRRRRKERSMTVVPGWEGRFFEDFNVGDVYRCRLGRTVTEADNIWFTLLTSNTNQDPLQQRLRQADRVRQVPDQQ